MLRPSDEMDRRHPCGLPLCILVGFAGLGTPQEIIVVGALGIVIADIAIRAVSEYCAPRVIDEALTVGKYHPKNVGNGIGGIAPTLDQHPLGVLGRKEIVLVPKVQRRVCRGDRHIPALRVQTFAQCAIFGDQSILLWCEARLGGVCRPKKASAEDKCNQEGEPMHCPPLSRSSTNVSNRCLMCVTVERRDPVMIRLSCAAWSGVGEYRW